MSFRQGGATNESPPQKPTLSTMVVWQGTTGGSTPFRQDPTPHPLGPRIQEKAARGERPRLVVAGHNFP